MNEIPEEITVTDSDVNFETDVDKHDVRTCSCAECVNTREVMLDAIFDPRASDTEEEILEGEEGDAEGAQELAKRSRVQGSRAINKASRVIDEFLDKEKALPVNPPQSDNWRTTSPERDTPKRFLDPDWAKLKEKHWKELKTKKLGGCLSAAPRFSKALDLDAPEIDFTTSTPVTSCSDLRATLKNISVNEPSFKQLEKAAGYSLRAANQISLNHRVFKAMRNKEEWGEKEDKSYEDVVAANELAIEQLMYFSSQLAVNLMLTKRTAILNKASLSVDVKAKCWSADHSPSSAFGKDAVETVRKHQSTAPQIVKGSIEALSKIWRSKLPPGMNSTRGRGRGRPGTQSTRGATSFKPRGRGRGAQFKAAASTSKPKASS